MMIGSGNSPFSNITTKTATATTNNSNSSCSDDDDNNNKNFVEQLFTQLLSSNTRSSSNNNVTNDDTTNVSSLHVPSSTTKYRNKITYGCSTVLIESEDDNQPLPHCDHHDQQQQHQDQDSNLSYQRKKTVLTGNEYSILAEEYINEICRTILEFWNIYMTDDSDNNHHINSSSRSSTTTTNNATNITNQVLLREIMVKGTRSKQEIIIRLTIQNDAVTAAAASIANEHGTRCDTWDLQKQLIFRQYIEDRCCLSSQYNHQHIRQRRRQFCICYNIMTHNTNIRPTKDASPLYFIPPLPVVESSSSSSSSNSHYHSNNIQSIDDDVTTTETSNILKYVMEITPNQIEYQISPDTFSEVNHPVELLQWYQTKEYIHEFDRQYHNNDSRPPQPPQSTAERIPKPKQSQSILIVSGRDISSFALGFGTLLSNDANSLVPMLCIDGFDKMDIVREHQREECDDLNIFQHVIAIQHCPLVHFDAVQNIQRFQQKQKQQVDNNNNSKKDDGAVPTFSVHQCSKATMVHAFQKELLQYNVPPNNIPPVYGVMTGGRKGLDVSYVQFLNHYRSIRGIVYNSCATRSLLRDMTGFMLRGPYFLDKFRSYDFLPNTQYTASLTKLIRRPRTLILVIGPAGVGKSTMIRKLMDQYSNNTADDNRCKSRNNIMWWERDRIFADLRNRGFSLAKTKTAVHASLLKVLRRGDIMYEEETSDVETICNTTSIEVDDIDDNTAVIIIDSTNGNTEGRHLYVKEAKPDLVIYVNFEVNETDETKVIDFLLECTKPRLCNNTDEHPSFPQSINDQRIKHRNILRGMEYPTTDELERIQLDNDDFPTVKRAVLLSCDPRNAQRRSQLPYKVFLEYTASAEIRNALF